MKYFSLLIIFLLQINLSYSQSGKTTKGNKIDTIYCTAGSKTYVIFPDLVDWVDAGIKSYLSKKSGKTVFFAADKSGLEPAMLVVKYGNQMWHGTIAYKEHLSENEQFVNLDNVEPENMPSFVNEERVKEDESVSLSQKLMKRRLGILEGNPTDEEKQYAILSDKIIFKASIIRQDEEHFYFKLGLYNKSKLDFIVDIVDFEYKDIDASSGLESNHYEIPQDSYASKVNENGVTEVKGKDMVYLFYVVKKFKLSDKGSLAITVREKEGTRVLSFEIPQSVLIKSESFNQN